LDKDAKSIFDLVREGTPVLVIDKENDGYRYSAESAGQFPKVAAKSYLVADLDSGFVFAEKNFEMELPIASLTKLMTAVVVAENVDLRKSVEITSSMLQAYGSTEGLDEGKSFRVVELFYPLLTLSSNDAAQALGYFLSFNNTVRLMNEKAKAISMENTEFVGLDGFAAENVSTARDIFYLIRYILNNRPPLLKITKGEKVPAFGQVRFGNLFNKNVFVDDPDFIGGKTGFLNVSRYNGAFTFGLTDKNNKERRIAIIILGTTKTDKSDKEPDNLKTDTEAIVSWLKESYFKETEL
jgi:D-alanyl-D-alanine carboxypeptidase (penicillin-binding protein 5/6)